MMTLELLPIDIDALEEEMEGDTRSAVVTTTTPSQKKGRNDPSLPYETTKITQDNDDFPEFRRIPRQQTLPEIDNFDRLPPPRFPVPIPINSLTVKSYQPQIKPY